MRETSSDLYSTGAANTPNIASASNVPNIAYAPDHFFWYEGNKKKRRVGFKCCCIAVVFLGANALSFYVGYLVSGDNNDGSEYL